ncbi:vanin-like protein 1 [Cephus cinctus]|uniref:Vanin-like protein 1 n=1 Tax=Cephus cinctus TaxID=211228 RepID=A0AAJ7W2H0_CEPCN|nr:vanin-like protein 1 [Cephus cinctus]XP_015597849.1 vanin-like protein 1 [Cephus cinctus]XP_015597850.1 vanin-like protein 1 [Cephus cinctus]XP_024942079.1 vanin-like protein 1 [Cephus cinctus]
MREMQYILILLLAGIYDTQQRSTAESDTYMAAVVEFPPVFFKDDANLTLLTNAKSYVNYIHRAGNQSADIIVFPEDGLTGLNLPNRKELDPWMTIIPDAVDNYTPCTGSTLSVSDALKLISCAARDNQIYVVINIAEKLPCEKDGCPSDKFLYYNTNVVFDRNGKVIAKYRKTNLFGEYQFNVTEIPEVVTFDTDFGVTFGTFICFDILFKVPAMNLTRVLGVKDIIFSTAWFSESPFLTAVQTQYGWSFAEDVNLLASGYNNPQRGNAGSGIYLGRNGVGTAIMPLQKKEALLVYEVPKKIKSTVVTKNQDDISNSKECSKADITIPSQSQKPLEYGTVYDLTLIYDNLDVFETAILTEGVTETKLCQNKFCCDFSVNMSNANSNTTYLLAVFYGTRTYVRTIVAGTASCAVIQCSNKSSTSCGRVQNSDTVFNSLVITGTFENCNDVIVMPMSLNSSILPIAHDTYMETIHEEHKHVTISIQPSTKNLVTFALYARDFTRDGLVSSASGYKYIFYSFILPVSIFLYLFTWA